MSLHSVPQGWVYWGKQISSLALASLNAVNLQYHLKKNGHEAAEISSQSVSDN